MQSLQQVHCREEGCVQRGIQVAAEEVRCTFREEFALFPCGLWSQMLRRREASKASRVLQQELDCVASSLLRAFRRLWVVGLKIGTSTIDSDVPGSCLPAGGVLGGHP